MNSKTMFFFICLFLLFPPAGVTEAMAVAMAAAIGIPLTQNGGFRQAVFDALKEAIEKQGGTPAEVVLHSAALDEAVASGVGRLSIAPDTGAFIYTATQNATQILLTDPISPEDLSSYDKLILFFKDFRNAFALTSLHLQGLDNWGKFNALSSAVMTAIGLTGFAANCVTVGNNVVKCGTKIIDGVKNFTYEGILSTRKYFNIAAVAAVDAAAAAAAVAADPAAVAAVAVAAAAAADPAANPDVVDDAAKRLVISKELNKIIKQIERNNKGPIHPDQLVRDLIYPKLVSSSVINTIKKTKNAWRHSTPNIYPTKVTNKNGNTRIIPYKFNFLRKGGSKRKSSKINSKRRRHKTKKRAYRSTRFASHK
jgi:hypothetical protein